MEPRENRYARSHEYVHLDDDVAIVGITNYAQKELGDVVFVELPQVGTTLEAGDELGSIESVKAVSELFAPLSGEVIEVNEVLADKPDLVNSDPYGDGWMIKVRISDPSELDQLMTVKDYEDYIKSES
ncbi:MAG TPA: glycine cleavage system protein GcvH [Thermoanaerobaculia bacterium]|nr:glycine cleavage system protein GcvH [Thermoanaerobaculia bacterium]